MSAILMGEVLVILTTKGEYGFRLTTMVLMHLIGMFKTHKPVTMNQSIPSRMNCLK